LRFQLLDPALLRRNRLAAFMYTTVTLLAKLSNPAPHDAFADVECVAGFADTEAVVEYCARSLDFEFRGKISSGHVIPLSGRYCDLTPCPESLNHYNIVPALG